MTSIFYIFLIIIIICQDHEKQDGREGRRERDDVHQALYPKIYHCDEQYYLHAQTVSAINNLSPLSILQNRLPRFSNIRISWILSHGSSTTPFDLLLQNIVMMR